MTRIQAIISQFVAGIRSPWNGANFILKSPPTKKIIAIPFVIIVSLFFICLYLSYSYLPPVIAESLLPIENWFINNWPAALSFKFFSYIGGFLLASLKFILYLVLFSLNLVFAWLIGNILCSFFWEILAEKMLSQSQHFNVSMPLKVTVKNVVTSMLRELFKELLLLTIVAITWLMTFLPILGQSVFIVLLPLLSSVILGYANIDYAFSVLGLPIKDRFAWAKQNIPFLLGAGIYGLIFPVVYFLYPSFIVGGLLVHADHILLQLQDTQIIKTKA
ncbi:MAG TPA: EI24 domain-containing protein [Oligoflexia bacterium]|nr:EI24 domain-containing protein [Oligoflexia bacterium]HMR25719.1 EI24 domain-containing protein [Oligoflexia bacterium]